MIKKINNKFCTIHCHGKDKGKIISCFPTKKEALAQHKAIIVNKIEINLNLLKDERGTHEGYVTVHRQGKTFHRKQRLGQKEKEKNNKNTLIIQGLNEFNQKLDITDKYDVDLETLKSNSVKLKIGNDEVYISREAGYFPKSGGNVTYFTGKVVIGKKEWFGKDIKEIPEIIETINNHYNQLEKIKTGGNFKNAKLIEDNNIISSALESYKSTIGTSFYLNELTEAYLNNNETKIPNLDNKLEREYNELKKYAEKYKDDHAYVEAINERIKEIENNKLYNKIQLIGDHENLINKLNQNAVNQFYSEVNRTQEDLKKRFKDKDTIILYRGVQGDYADLIKSELKKDENIMVDCYVTSSWTSDKSIARDFAAKGEGVIIKKEIPIKDILFSYFTSPYIRMTDYQFGGNAEYEFIVANKDKKIKINREDIVE